MSRILTDFSRAEYERLLDDFLAAGYRTMDYPSAAALQRFDEPWLLIRHDIDFCVQTARDMALVEAQRSMVATYFLMVRTPFYNLLNPETSKAVREILAAGHKIGLHFDRMTYPPGSSPEILAKGCRKGSTSVLATRLASTRCGPILPTSRTTPASCGRSARPSFAEKPASFRRPSL